MKRIDATKWPLACASMFLMAYIIVIDNILMQSLFALSTAVCVILLLLAICNIFYFESSGGWQRYKIFSNYILVKNARVFIIIGIIMILFFVFTLSKGMHRSIPYVYSVAAFYYASLIRIKL